MEESFQDIAHSALDIVEFARCPYIHKIYSHIMLEGFCADSYSGLYNIHVSHLATLSMFFALMVNAALLYPHYKGKTMKHLCPCCFSKEVLDKEDQMLEGGVYLFEDVMNNVESDSGSEDDDDDVETGGGVELTGYNVGDTGQYSSVVKFEGESVGLGDTFSFVNPTFVQVSRNSPPPASGAMVRVKAEDSDESYL